LFGGAVIYRIARRRAAQRIAKLSQEERQRVAELLASEPTEGGRS
jgi:cytochrome c-type biogenesis protein CcmH/NrfF